MTPCNLIGWLAASFMLAAFACKEPRTLRLFAIAANALFIVYGLEASVVPVAMLHLLLLPVNVLRLLAVVGRLSIFTLAGKRAAQRIARVTPLIAVLCAPLAACNSGNGTGTGPLPENLEVMRPVQPFDEQLGVSLPP